MTTTLAQVIGWIESRNKNYAIRFEPEDYFNRKVDPDIIGSICASNNCDDETAQMIACTSWGEYQIMGFNLYSDPYTAPFSIARFLSSQSIQYHSFLNFVTRNRINFTIEQLSVRQFRDEFALAYNGSQEYGNAIVESLKHFGVNTK